MIQTSGSQLLHWNYFLALDSDFDVLSRYIELAESNFQTYSIELAHLLLSASSEADVVLKALCSNLDPTSKARNICDYQSTLTARLPIAGEAVYVPRFCLTLHPFDNWHVERTPPDWWQSYNKVKHHRDEYFQQANLKNALNALAGLLVAVFYFYRETFVDLNRRNISVTQRLQPEPRLLRLSDTYYYDTMVAATR